MNSKNSLKNKIDKFDHQIFLSLNFVQNCLRAKNYRSGDLFFMIFTRFVLIEIR